MNNKPIESIFVLYAGWKCVLWSVFSVHAIYVSCISLVWRNGWDKSICSIIKYKRVKTSSRSATNSPLHESTNRNIYYQTLFIPSSSYYSCDYCCFFFSSLPLLHPMPCFFFDEPIPFFLAISCNMFVTLCIWHSHFFVEFLFLLLFTFNHNNDCIITKVNPMWKKCIKHEGLEEEKKYKMNMNQYASSAWIEEYLSFFLIWLPCVATATV